LNENLRGRLQPEALFDDITPSPSMINRKKAQRILWYEAIGFLLIIALSWLDELLSLPARLFGGVQHTNWREAAMETTIVLAVWLVVFVFTKRLLVRLYYLEGFLRVCAWCRKIGHDDEWMPLETYFSKGFDIKTSHSICPACAKKMEAESEPGVQEMSP
jgi:hypothetical protein